MGYDFWRYYWLQLSFNFKNRINILTTIIIFIIVYLVKFSLIDM